MPQVPLGRDFERIFALGSARQKKRPGIAVFISAKNCLRPILHEALFPTFSTISAIFSRKSREKFRATSEGSKEFPRSQTFPRFH